MMQNVPKCYAAGIFARPACKRPSAVRNAHLVAGKGNVGVDRKGPINNKAATREVVVFNEDGDGAGAPFARGNGSRGIGGILCWWACKANVVGEGPPFAAVKLFRSVNCFAAAYCGLAGSDVTAVVN